MIADVSSRKLEILYLSLFQGQELWRLSLGSACLPHPLICSGQEPGLDGVAAGVAGDRLSPRVLLGRLPAPFFVLSLEALKTACHSPSLIDDRTSSRGREQKVALGCRQ